MISSYQDRKSLEDERAAPAAAQLATVDAVYADGISLIFDGDSAPTDKHYKCNAAISFSAGQRVKIVKISGTYVVEYPIGNPKQ